jgi:soluble lytic murein transglycosylase-like protein
MRLPSFAGFIVLATLLSGCVEFGEVSSPGPTAKPETSAAAQPASASNTEMADGADARSRAHQLRQVIEQQARENAVPVALAHAVIRIESNYNSKIVHAGNYGLMQIRLATARSLGFGGPPASLLDPAINLHYGLKYLGGAYQQAGGDLCRAIMKYQSGLLAIRMSGANRIYCQRVKSLMSSST